MTQPTERPAPCWSGVPVILDGPDLAQVAAAKPSFPFPTTGRLDVAHQLDEYGMAAVVGQYLSMAMAATAQGQDHHATWCMRLAVMAYRTGTVAVPADLVAPL